MGRAGVLGYTISDGHLSFLSYVIWKTFDPHDWSGSFLVTSVLEIYHKWDPSNCKG